MKFKFCPNCGHKVTNPQAKFCPNCGYKFNGANDDRDAQVKSKPATDQTPPIHPNQNPQLNTLINKDNAQPATLIMVGIDALIFIYITYRSLIMASTYNDAGITFIYILAWVCTLVLYYNSKSYVNSYPEGLKDALNIALVGMPVFLIIVFMIGALTYEGA